MKKYTQIAISLYLILLLGCSTKNTKEDYSSKLTSVTFIEGYSMDSLIKSILKMNDAIRDSIKLSIVQDSSLNINKSLIEKVKESKIHNEGNFPLFEIYGPNINREDGTAPNSMYLGVTNSKDTALLNNYFSSKKLRAFFPNDFIYRYITVTPRKDIISIIGLKNKPLFILNKQDIKKLSFIKPNPFSGVGHVVHDILSKESLIPCIVIDKSTQKKLSNYRHIFIDLEYINNKHFFKLIENNMINDTIIFD